MLTRRSVILSGVATLALLAPMARVRAQGADATGFIQQLGGRLVAVVNGPGNLQQKRAQMQPLVDAAVDVDGIARFCLGRFWRTATPQQQAEYLRLFHFVLLNNVTGKLGEFRGVTFNLTNTAQRGEETAVGTTIIRPNQQPATVQWIVGQAGGAMKIVDVIIEGTSLRLTQRNDYNSYVSRNGNNVDALLSAMRQQTGT